MAMQASTQQSMPVENTTHIPVTWRVQYHHQHPSRSQDYQSGDAALQARSTPLLATNFIQSKTPSITLGVLLWSHDRGSNPRPHPYHGCALPTELSRHIYLLLAKGALHILLSAADRALRPTVMYVSRRSYRGTNIILTDSSDVLKPCVRSIPSSRT